MTGYPRTISTSAVHPWAAATPSATVWMRSITAVRVCSLKQRSVPSAVTDSGITFVVVPPRIRAIVSTAGSNTSTLRVIIDWSASTTSHATGIGSLAQCGVDACPPRPRTVMNTSSAEAMAGPGR